MADNESNALSLDEDESSPLSPEEIVRIRTRDDAGLQMLWDETVRNSARNWFAQGVILNEFKRRKNHGEWVAWLEANWPKSIRAAQMLMRVTRFVEEENIPMPSLAASEQETQPVSQARAGQEDAKPVAHSGPKRTISYKRVLREHATPRPQPVINEPIDVSYTVLPQAREDTAEPQPMCVCPTCGAEHRRQQAPPF